MGHFLSLRIELPDVSALRPSQVLAPCFSDPFFTPVALGGVDAAVSGDDWYIAGYALENFVSGFIERQIPEPASIQQAASPDNEAYLQSIADALTGRRSLADRLSPFETAESALTFVRNVDLAATVLEDSDQWVAQHPKAAIYLYGTLNLARRDRAFRFRLSDESLIHVPILWVRLGLSPFTARMGEVLLYSQSPVWLDSSEGTLAEGHLEGLAALALRLASARPRSSATLRLDGSAFENERPRIERALAGTLAHARKP